MLSPSTPISDAFSVQGRVTLITGAAGFIGSGIAETFARAGAQVLLTDFPGEGLDRTLADFESKQLPVAAHPADLKNPDHLKALIDFAQTRFDRLDCIINCAAVTMTPHLQYETPQSIADVFQINLGAAILLAKHATALLEASDGCIVNIASINGHTAQHFCAVYASTKAGLLMLTRELALELAGKNIRVNSVSPGTISKIEMHLRRLAAQLYEPHASDITQRFTDDARTAPRDLQPLKRVGQPVDVAFACLYLASPAARFITGADILVDGGMLVQPNHKDPPPDSSPWKRIRAHLRALPLEAWKLGPPPWLNQGPK